MKDKWEVSKTNGLLFPVERGEEITVTPVQTQ